MRSFVQTALAAIAGLSLVSSAMAQKSHQYDNDTAVTIIDNAPASPYATSVFVAGVNAPIGSVKVALRGLSHTFPADLGVLLVGPSGQSVVLMGRVGGYNPGVVGANYLFTQDAVPMSKSNLNSPSGRYAPTQNGPTTFTAPAPAGPWGASLDAFKGQSANGFWTLYVNDGASGDIGSIAGWSLIIEEAPSYSNERPVTIPTIGAAGPYPTTATVDGLEGSVRSVRIMITGFTHSCSTDVRYMLQSPSGQTCLFMARCGTCGAVSGDFIFDDNAANPLPAAFSGPLVPGTYKPSVCTTAAPSVNFAAPAPAAPYGTTLSVFNGSNPNGQWKLWIEDLYNGDLGQLAGGWSLIINGQSCPADFNKSGGLEVQDIFDFLNAWLATCP